ncbi:hypothetical protein [Paracoccus denitrificans]|jgi:hypothetical protein|uniref:RcnB family protein n=1 Tax=Paracoccus denitrificans (strain Pd 1222) TaxID=318586 RepID=A1B7L8_PARDP|nr:hypothetical protein [Paracoccus denitrificans]ABL71512.1 hypothetical protein Pden_3441 [Paracoccus denitrificans PD1222]MBB4629773.1 hypothetical protein [Paracoccus denitrificans]MCU7431182.1 hypothetical protein [Paracoccus denitrificans]QAR28113.1 hypothetical protein EO213_17450 [Paracoccus denitrificans]UPV97840.1 hypothetical protein M0K93_17525 [Paracoccus denitrificans]
MRRFFMITAIAATTLGSSQMAMAETRPDGPPPECRQNDRKCPAPPSKDARKKGERSKGEHRPPPSAEARRDGHKPRQAPDHRPGEGREAKGKPPADGRQALRVGDSGRDGRAFQRAGNSRYAPAPRGQEYRVIRDQLVLVDQKSKRIVSILGPIHAQR